MRALSRNTRRATAVTLAAALVIAVYLNWQYARSDVPTELPDNAAMVAAEAEDVPVQAQTVLDELPTEAEAVSSANKNYGEAQLVSVASDSGAKFFEQARLKRQKAHDEAMDSIKKTMKSSSLSAEEKKEYTAQMTVIVAVFFRNITSFDFAFLEFYSIFFLLRNPDTTVVTEMNGCAGCRVIGRKKT